MRVPICLLGILVVTACAAPVNLTEGMPNTRVVVNPSGATEVVCDLRGTWVSDDGTITIKQDGPVVEAFWQEYHGCCFCRVDHRWFRGTLAGRGVNGLRYLCMSARFEPLSIHIADGGDEFSIAMLLVDTPSFLTFKRMK